MSDNPQFKSSDVVRLSDLAGLIETLEKEGIIDPVSGTKLLTRAKDLPNANSMSLGKGKLEVDLDPSCGEAGVSYVTESGEICDVFYCSIMKHIYNDNERPSGYGDNDLRCRVFENEFSEDPTRTFNISTDALEESVGNEL